MAQEDEIKQSEDFQDNILEESSIDNSIVDIKKYLQDGDPTLTSAEFTQFWQSLTDEEKADYKSTPLPKSE